MNTMQIATKLVQLCREGKNAEALNTLFAEDAVSVEAGGPPDMDRCPPCDCGQQPRAMGAIRHGDYNDRPWTWPRTISRYTASMMPALRCYAEHYDAAKSFPSLQN